MHLQRVLLGTPVGRLGALCLIVTTVSATGSTPRAEAMATLLQLIGTATCDDDGQCRTVAVGHRACGGPGAYLAWSVKETDPAALQRAVARYNATQTAQPPGGRFSTCEFLTDPGAVCLPAAASAGTVVKSCQLGPKRGSPTLPSR